MGNGGLSVYSHPRGFLGQLVSHGEIDVPSLASREIKRRSRQKFPSF